MTLYSGYFNREADAEPNPGYKSPPTTRPFSALPLVTSLLSLGVDGVTARLRVHLEAVQTAADYLREQPDFELMHEQIRGLFVSGIGRRGLKIMCLVSYNAGFMSKLCRVGRGRFRRRR